MDMPFKDVGEAVLPDLLRGAGTLTAWEPGKDAIVFRVCGLPRTFQPPGEAVLSHCGHVARDTAGEYESFWLLTVNSRLVRFSVFCSEAMPSAMGQGAVYIGNDTDHARLTALAQMQLFFTK